MKSHPNRNSYAQGFLFAFLLVAAAAVRIWGLGFGLPYKYHIDEPPSVLAALRIAQGDFVIEYPPLSPNLQQLVLTGLYGILFIVQLVGGYVSSPEQFALTYQQDPTVFYLLARGLSVLSSLLTLCILYRLVSKLRNRQTAILAVFLLAFCFLDVRHSHFVEPYSLIALMAVITAYAAIQYLSVKKLVWLLVSGIASGIGVGLRFSTAPLVVGPLLAIGLQFFRREDKPASKIRTLLVHVALLLLSFVVGLLVGTPSLILNTRNSLSTAATQIALAATAEGFWGFAFTDWPTWRFYGAILEIAWGMPVIIAIMLGFLRAIKSYDEETFVILIFPLLYSVVLLSASAASSSFARYLVPVLPFLALLGADGVMVITEWLSKYLPAKFKTTMMIFLAIMLISVPAARIIRLDYLWTQTDTRTLAKEWIEQHIPSNLRIAIQWHGPPLATQDDPEPNSSRVYEVDLLDPFSSDSEMYSIQHYWAQGFDYIILSSYIYELHRVEPVENSLRQAFYRELDSDLELMAEFNPFTDQSSPSFFFEELWGPITTLWQRERPGPVIKIYRLTP